ncbi:MAG: OmpH family outer membrane protein [Patiriisocius sp.]|uniref:OmpH family outer membrane protein n=1 Tax=Patiriisocius sp. TaxID=2822396 RepID=UPI003EF9CE24
MLKRNLLVIINIILLLCLAIIISIHFLWKKDKQEIVHFDNAKVFSEFNYSKELSQQGMNTITIQKKRVDSIVNLLQQEINDTKKEALQREFVSANENLKRMSEEISNQANYQIWSRINEYTKEFGEQNDYQMILGTTGNGNLMYAKNSLDVTEAFLAFANKKYEGE